MNGKIDIKSMLPDEIGAFLKQFNQPSYRARQIFSWLHRGVESYDEMTDISKDLRAVLKEKTFITVPNIEKRLVSNLDDTVKYLYAMQDGECVETVLMSYHHGNSICVSTQAGCRMNCGFCASGIGGLQRNLSPSEILDQILFTAKDRDCKIGSVVLLGTGEPLDNYDNVLKFLKLMSCEERLRMSLRHVSLSTCGLVDKIYDLMKEKLQLSLSVSLHAPNDEIRNRIMPVSRKCDIETLLAGCWDYL